MHIRMYIKHVKSIFFGSYDLISSHYSEEPAGSHSASRGLMSARVFSARRWPGEGEGGILVMCETFRPNYFADLSISTFRSSSIFPHSHARGPEPPVWHGIKAPRRGFFSVDSKGKNRQEGLSHGVPHFCRCVVSQPLQSDTFEKRLRERTLQ